MIISHKHKFIFLKTNKTAGTSIEIALSRFCGKKDIITPIASEDEKIRKKSGYRGSQNYLAPISGYSLGDFKKLIFSGERKERFYNHISAKEVKGFIGERVWNEYFKFCFERNPWDRLLSLYYWRCNSEPRPSISEFLDSEVPSMLTKMGFGVYAIDGEIAVDKVCKYENIADELEAVRTRLNLPEKLELPRAKSRFRKDKRSYDQVLNEEQKEKIARLFSKEIELWGYGF
jgi:hypothetical protein